MASSSLQIWANVLLFLPFFAAVTFIARQIGRYELDEDTPLTWKSLFSELKTLLFELMLLLRVVFKPLWVFFVWNTRQVKRYIDWLLGRDGGLK